MRLRMLLAGASGCLATLSACGGGPSTSSYCDAARNAKTTLGVLSQAGNLGNDAASLQRFKTGIATAAQALDNMDAQAPSQIASDLHLLRNTLDNISNAVKSATTPDQVLSALLSSVSSLGSDASTKLSNAANHVQTYTKTTCGFDLTTSTSSST